jgi:DNA-binding MarR family transcriptional regulator
MAPKLDDDTLGAWRAFINAHDRVTRRINRDLAGAGLPELSWYDVLWSLRRAPDRRLRVNELADAVVLSRTGLVRLVDRIESAGLVRREPVPADRRGAYVVLDDAGEQMLRRMWPVYAQGIDSYFGQALGASPARARKLFERIADAAGP